LPVLFEGETKAVIELAALHKFTDINLTFLEQLTQSIGVVLNTIEATMRTEGLLVQSQSLTTELQARQSELQQTNEALEQKAHQLAEQNIEVERKNTEVEQARRALEEKAAELALTSKYKSEFLANMSHELRTPLNSILILGQQLAENSGGNLSLKQTDFAKNIHSAGSYLLTLINDILDCRRSSRERSRWRRRKSALPRCWKRSTAVSVILPSRKNLPFHVNVDPGCRGDDDRPETPAADTEEPAFQCVQVHRAGPGRSALQRRIAGWSPDHPVLSRAAGVVSLAVNDTGIGIAPDKQRLIFEAFQQADAGTRASTAARVLDWRFRANSRRCSAAKSAFPARPNGQHLYVVPAVGLYRPVHCDAQRARIECQRGHRHRSRFPSCPWPARRASKTTANSILEGDNVLLIIEDDPHYARVLLGLAREKGFKAIVAQRGATVWPMRGNICRPPLRSIFSCRTCWLDGAQQPQARPAHAPYPGADHFTRRKNASTVSRMARSPTWSSR
jgi:signal transduction histidine kinase